MTKREVELEFGGGKCEMGNGRAVDKESRTEYTGWWMREEAVQAAEEENKAPIKYEQEHRVKSVIGDTILPEELS